MHSRMRQFSDSMGSQSSTGNSTKILSGRYEGELLDVDKSELQDLEKEANVLTWSLIKVF